MSGNPLRKRRDYGSGVREPDDMGVPLYDEDWSRSDFDAEMSLPWEPNEYLNTSPTELHNMLLNETDPEEREKMQDALYSWRRTVPGPFWRSAVARELIKVAKLLDGKEIDHGTVSERNG